MQKVSAQKHPEKGVNRRFQHKRAKIFKLLYYRTTEAIPAKFNTVKQTTKYSLWVVEKFSPQIQTDGRS